MLEHGGRLREAARRHDIPLENWLDLSTGINPIGYPVAAIDPACWRRLPEDDDGLEAAACAYYGAPNALAMHGSQAAIQLLPRLFPPQHVAVLHPGYAEHAAGWKRAGHSVQSFSAEALDGAAAACKIIVLIHPNNPTGVRFDPDRLLNLAETLNDRAGVLVVDEAFMDVTPEKSLAPHTDRVGLIVLRSLGKFFGLAGARVGFALGEAKLLQALRELAGPWAIPGPSRAAAIAALGDSDWQAVTRHRLLRDGARLAGLLRQSGLEDSQGTALFQWLPHSRADFIFEWLARHGVLTRLFADPPSVRFGLPAMESEWRRLAAALEELRNALAQ